MTDEANDEKTPKKIVPWPDHNNFRGNLFEGTSTFDSPVIGTDGKNLANIAQVNPTLKDGSRLADSGRDIYVEIFDPNRINIQVADKEITVSDVAGSSTQTRYFTDETDIVGEEGTPERERAKFLLNNHGASTVLSTHIIVANKSDTARVLIEKSHNTEVHDTDARFITPYVDFNNAQLDVMDRHGLPVDYTVKAGQTLNLTMPLPEKILKPFSIESNGFASGERFNDEVPLVTTQSVHQRANQYEEPMPTQFEVKHSPQSEDFRGIIMACNNVHLPNGSQIRMQSGAKLDLQFVDENGQLVHKLNYHSKDGTKAENPKKGEFEDEFVGVVPQEDIDNFTKARVAVQAALIAREEKRAQNLAMNTEQYNIIKQNLADGKQPEQGKGEAIEGVTFNRVGNALYVTQPENGEVPITIRGQDVFVGKEANDALKSATAMIDAEAQKTHSQPLEEALHTIQATKPRLSLKDVDFLIVNGSEKKPLLSIVGDGNTYQRTTPLRLIQNTNEVQIELIGNTNNNSSQVTATRFEDQPITIERIGQEAITVNAPKHVEWKLLHEGTMTYNSDYMRFIEHSQDSNKIGGLALGGENGPQVLLNDKQNLNLKIMPFKQHRVAKDILANQLFDVTHPERSFKISGSDSVDDTKKQLLEQQSTQEKENPEKWKFLPNENAGPPRVPIAPAGPMEMVQIPETLRGAPPELLAAAKEAAILRAGETISGQFAKSTETTHILRV